MRRAWSAAAAALVLALASLTGRADAQSAANLAESCATAGGDASLCQAAAASGRALMGHTGLLAGVGSPVPGTASNLGRRVGGRPRLSLFARMAALSMGLPDPSDPEGAAESSSVVPAIHVGAAAGLFDGLRLMPTVGGFLATDVFAHAAFLLPGESDGFGGGMTSLTAGVRVGIFREGFTIPGVSVSVARRFSGGIDFGDTGAGDQTAVAVDPSVTSVRATVGKDLLAVELLAGLGWDDYSGQTTVRVSDGAGGFATATGDLSGSRRMYFGSAAMTFSLVLSLSVEAGFAEGLSPIPGYTGAHDPGSGSFFYGFSGRLTL